MLPTVEDVMHKLKGSTVFTKLDATSGFWQLSLDDATAKLTAFTTPFGRYFFRCLPFGISLAPEVFQRTMENIFGGADLCEMKGQKYVVTVDYYSRCIDIAQLPNITSSSVISGWYPVFISSAVDGILYSFLQK